MLDKARSESTQLLESRKHFCALLKLYYCVDERWMCLSLASVTESPLLRHLRLFCAYLAIGW